MLYCSAVMQMLRIAMVVLATSSCSTAMRFVAHGEAGGNISFLCGDANQTATFDKSGIASVSAVANSCSVDTTVHVELAVECLHVKGCVLQFARGLVPEPANGDVRMTHNEHRDFSLAPK
jgi:hypothetical protein